MAEDVKRVFNVRGNYIERQEIKVENGGVLNFGLTEMGKDPEREDEVKEAVMELLELTDAEGKRVFTDQGQWYAVYRVLNELCNYPKSMRDFCRCVKRWELPEEAVKCTYAMMTDRQKVLTKLLQKVTTWHMCKDMSDAYGKQWAVADFLIKKFS